VSLDNRKKCIELVQESISAGATQEASCQILELSARTLQRWQVDPEKEDMRQGPHTPSPKSLTEKEKHAMLVLANSEDYRNLNPHKIVVKLADSGKYLASESSFYRLLKTENQLKHRSRSRAKTKQPPRSLIAKNPNEVWSWDITYLQGLIRGKFFYLYMIEDIFSRMIVGWSVEEVESAEHSARLMEQSCIGQKISKGQIDLHADNGGPMKGCTMLATLKRLGIAPSFSRPSVSNDNPFSESLFKTLKYCPQFPSKPFETIEEARRWVTAFVKWYNEEHLHSEIRFVTPQSRHQGRDGAILKNRIAVYENAKRISPLRWSGKIRNWSPITEVILNPGKEQKVKKELLRNQAA
jgi:putative transposase